MNVREQQFASLVEMLRQTDATSTLDSKNKFSQKWKLLIYDQACKEIISPMLNVPQLREHGVTLYMLIKGKRRDPIPDVPAVYFVYPTRDNVELIKQDLQRRLYDSVYINFAAPTSQEILQQLAQAAVETESVGVISRVYEQNLGYVTLEPDLATLNMPDSFLSYYKSNLSEQQIMSTMDSIAQGVCCLVSSLKVVPVIRAPKGGPANMVAGKVSTMLHNMLNDPESVYNSGGGTATSTNALQRPMLLILDRSVDMATVLKHSHLYQTCIDDILDLSLNRVTIEKEGKKELSSLDSSVDDFWKTHAGKTVDVVISACQNLLKEVVEAEKNIKSPQTKDPTAQQNGMDNMLSSVQSLPALMETKKRLNMHLHLLSEVMTGLEKRDISYEMTTDLDKEKTLAFISNAQLQLEDKIRLVGVYLLTAEPSPADVTEVTKALDEFCSIAPQQPGAAAGQQTQQQMYDVRNSLEFLRRMVYTSKAPAQQASVTSTTSSSIWSLASGQAHQALNLAKKQVKGMVGGETMLTATRMLGDVCKEATPAKAAEIDAEYAYFDPKLGSTVNPTSRIRTAFKKSMLFMVGGGCYLEYHNVRETAKSQGREVVYGCSEIVNAKQFIRQLSLCKQ